MIHVPNITDPTTTNNSLISPPQSIIQDTTINKPIVPPPFISNTNPPLPPPPTTHPITPHKIIKKINTKEQPQKPTTKSIKSKSSIATPSSTNTSPPPPPSLIPPVSIPFKPKDEIKQPLLLLPSTSPSKPPSSLLLTKVLTLNPFILIGIGLVCISIIILIILYFFTSVLPITYLTTTTTTVAVTLANPLSSSSSSSVPTGNPFPVLSIYNPQAIAFGGFNGYVNGILTNILTTINSNTTEGSCDPGYTSTQVYGTYGVDYSIYLCSYPLSYGQYPKYIFGGMYSYMTGYGNTLFYLRQIHQNPLTGDASCPIGFSTVPLLGIVSTDDSLFYCYRLTTQLDIITNNSMMYNFGGIFGYASDSGITLPITHPIPTYPNPVTTTYGCSNINTFNVMQVYGFIYTDNPLYICLNTTTSTTTNPFNRNNYIGSGDDYMFKGQYLIDTDFYIQNIIPFTLLNSNITITYAIYVDSTLGNDIINNGLINKPLKTINKAKQYVNNIINSGGGVIGNIIVYLNGEFVLNNTLVFNAIDTYNSTVPITSTTGLVIYTTNPRSQTQASISGGIKIRNPAWILYTGNIYRLAYPTSEILHPFRTFYLDGNTRIPRAKSINLETYANQGYYGNSNNPTTTQCSYSSPTTAYVNINNCNTGTFPTLTNGQSYSMEAVFTLNWYSSRCLGVLSYTSSTRYTFSFNEPNCASSVNLFSYSTPQYGITDISYFENSLLFLTQPGTCVIDNQYIYYIPNNANELTFDIVIPQLTQLMVMYNVHNLIFNNILFSYTIWDIGNGMNIRQDDNIINYASLNNPWRMLEAAIYCYSCYNTVIMKSTLTHLGGTAIVYSISSYNNLFWYNNIIDVSGSGIRIGDTSFGGVNLLDTNPSLSYISPLDTYSNTSHTYIEDNTIDSIGIEWWGTVGIFAATTNYCYLKNNIISNCPYTGISSGNSGTTLIFPNLFKIFTLSNHIHHVMNQLVDGAAIYLNNAQKGSTIGSNYIHSIGNLNQLSSHGMYTSTLINAGYVGGTHGIYIDQGTYESFYYADNIMQNINTPTHNSNGPPGWQLNNQLDGNRLDWIAPTLISVGKDPFHTQTESGVRTLPLVFQTTGSYIEFGGIYNQIDILTAHTNIYNLQQKIYDNITEQLYLIYKINTPTQLPTNLFGGIYSTLSLNSYRNPYTLDYTCPNQYQTILASNNLRIYYCLFLNVNSISSYTYNGLYSYHTIKYVPLPCLPCTYDTVLSSTYCPICNNDTTIQQIYYPNLITGSDSCLTSFYPNRVSGYLYSNNTNFELLLCMTTPGTSGYIDIVNSKQLSFGGIYGIVNNIVQSPAPNGPCPNPLDNMIQIYPALYLCTRILNTNELPDIEFGGMYSNITYSNPFLSSFLSTFTSYTCSGGFLSKQVLNNLYYCYRIIDKSITTRIEPLLLTNNFGGLISNSYYYTSSGGRNCSYPFRTYQVYYSIFICLLSLLK